MKADVNLRSDLAKLSDAELAERLKTNWNAYEATGVPPPGRFSITFPLLYSLRGPIRHRRAYRFLATIVNTDSIWLSLLFATLLSSSRLEGLLRLDSTTDAHLSLCEIRDIIDEIERRVKQKRANP